MPHRVCSLVMNESMTPTLEFSHKGSVRRKVLGIASKIGPTLEEAELFAVPVKFTAGWLIWFENNHAKAACGAFFQLMQLCHHTVIHTDGYPVAKLNGGMLCHGIC
jgi:hypothetical protein